MDAVKEQFRFDDNEVVEEYSKIEGIENINIGDVDTDDDYDDDDFDDSDFDDSDDSDFDDFGDFDDDLDDFDGELDEDFEDEEDGFEDEDFEDEDFEDEDFEDEDFEDEDEFGADEMGAEADLISEGLMESVEDDNFQILGATDNNFINESGDIVVMDVDDKEDNFELKYIPIENITVVTRIRKGKMVEDLVSSIKSTGLLKPIVVAPLQTEGLYVLIDGYRRLLACARVGIRNVPSTINRKVSTVEIPVLEAMYNHSSRYTMKEVVDYIDYLENEKGIVSSTMIEYLLQLNSGDYAKLKDIMEDDDDDIVSKLMAGQIDISQAFKNLERRRNKESREEKEIKKTAKVYADTEESGADKLADSGEAGDGEGVLTDDEIESLAFNVSELDEVDEDDLDGMVEEGQKMDGFQHHKQKSGERERIDPAIRKAVMSRDDDTCQSCKRGGPDYVDILDLHHVVEVFLGGVDSVDNGVALCLNCHKQVHLYAYNQLHIPKSKTEDDLELEIEKKILEENTKRKRDGLDELDEAGENKIRKSHTALYREEQNKYKRIVKLGNVIRKGLQMRGIKLANAKKDKPIHQIGRQMPGTKNVIA